MPNTLRDAIEHHRRGDLGRAEALYRKILKVHPDHPDALHLMGCVELARGRGEPAVRLMRRAVDLAPTTALYHQNLAEAYHRTGRRDLAEAECCLTLRFDPDRPEALNRLGVLAMEEGELEAARDRLSEALAVRPLYVEALVNLAAVLTRLGDFDLAAQSAGLALGIEPEHLLAWNNLGLALRGAGRRAEAAEAFARAGSLPMARFNRGYLRLLEDDLAQGLPLLEARKELVNPGRRLRKPEWDGRPLPRKRLLVLHEQGMGDTLLVSRFLPALLERFAGVTVVVQDPLRRLVGTIDARLTVTTEVPPRGYDAWCLAMSLPHLLGIDAAERIPMEPRLAVAAPQGTRARFRAGINWAGNPSFHYDRVRSTSLDTVSDLLTIDGVEWVSLHRGCREAEAAARGLPQPLAEASDFLDTAAVIAGLDLVVSTETAVPNLSAAMGVPTIVLAAVDHDWRWRSWYRGVTVCAQDVPGEWGEAVVKARRAVEERAAAWYRERSGNEAQAA
jgi:Flp pilus assembly protein TadD